MSYEIPRLVDTLNLIYIIAASHKTLNGAEYNDSGLMDSPINKKTDSRYSE